MELYKQRKKINDEEIIDIYKRRWDIEQGYKELREYFGFDKEEKRKIN
jgi:IS4 transposase